MSEPQRPPDAYVTTTDTCSNCHAKLTNAETARTVYQGQAFELDNKLKEMQIALDFANLTADRRAQDGVDLQAQLAPWLQCATDANATFVNLMRGTIALGPELALKYAAAKGWKSPEESAAAEKALASVRGLIKVKHPSFDDEEKRCARCGDLIDLGDGLEWPDLSEALLCGPCATTVIESIALLFESTPADAGYVSKEKHEAILSQLDHAAKSWGLLKTELTAAEQRVKELEDRERLLLGQIGLLQQNNPWPLRRVKDYKDALNAARELLSQSEQRVKDLERTSKQLNSEVEALRADAKSYGDLQSECSSLEQRVRELEKDMAQCDSDRQTNGKIADDAIGRLHAAIERERVLREALNEIAYKCGGTYENSRSTRLALDALAATGKWESIDNPSMTQLHACQKCGAPGAIMHFPGGFLCPGGCKSNPLAATGKEGAQ